ncbi:MAG: RagB/SusD family nutrient uptake outer membrane protein [Ekhidna sp.]
MKNRILISILSLALFACDLGDIEPTEDITLDAAFADETALGFALNGMYDAYQDDDVGGGFTIFVADLIANNDIVFSGSFTSLQEVRSKSVTTSNVQIGATWDDHYETINAANAIIDAIENNDELDDGFAGAARGQALMMRAVCHFELVRLYGQTQFVPGATTDANTQLGVPIVTEPTLASDQITFPGRSTVGQVYDAVIADLQTAITLMDANGGGSTGQFDEWGARAYLARVYLQMADYANVLAITNEIITGGGFALVPSLRDNFFAASGEFGAESIIEVSHTNDDGPPGQTLTDFYNVNSRDDIDVSAEYLALEASLTNARMDADILANNYVVSDERYTELIIGGEVNKYEDATNEADNPPVSRYAEILLSNAEASVRVNGRNATALGYLNAVRNRSINVVDVNGDPVAGVIDYTLADFTTDQEMIDAILLERRVELAFEGYSWHDMARQNLAPAGFTWGANALAWPIPQGEVDVNPTIATQQNAGY